MYMHAVMSSKHIRAKQPCLVLCDTHETTTQRDTSPKCYPGCSARELR